MAREIIERRARRRPVKMPAQCRTQSGMRDSGEISNISTAGCCVTTPGLFIRVGSRIVIRPDGMEGLTGVVRWTEGNQAGVEFDTPLYAPIVDHLSERYSDGRKVSLSTY